MVHGKQVDDCRSLNSEDDTDDDIPELEESQSDGIIVDSRQQHRTRGPRNEHHTRVALPIRVILDEYALLTSSALRGVDRRLMYHNQGPCNSIKVNGWLRASCFVLGDI